ncbi:PilW family protein [Thiosocius teredinicola]|uniref:PilW family protein n=1 Tax=Thiosocius teredinicola TaxID=1973002 RepID=UPI0009911EA6
MSLRFKQKGLTLVELMISVALSLLLLAGVMVLFSGNKTSHRMQEGMSTLQDSGRYAVTAIKRDINAAGFGGCISSSQDPILIAASPLPYVREYRDGQLVAGENDVSGRTIEGEPVTDGTDVLQIRGPLGSAVFYVKQRVSAIPPIVVQGDASAFATGDYLVVSDCVHTEIFKASSVSVTTGPPASTTIAHASSHNDRGGIFQTKMGSDSVVMRLSTHTYFIAPSSWTNASGATVLSLYRATGDGSPDELLQGVEDMQVTYGIDSNGDGGVDSFRDAASVTDWTQVASVNVSLLVNSVDNASDTLASYRYSPVGSAAITPSNTADRLMRQEFTAVLTARNNLM